MTRQIIAFFASSFLSVAMTIPSMASEVDGVIEDIDMESETIRLSDGEQYRVPADFDFRAVRPGMTVVVIYNEYQEKPIVRLV